MRFVKRSLKSYVTKRRRLRSLEWAQNENDRDAPTLGSFVAHTASSQMVSGTVLRSERTKERLRWVTSKTIILSERWHASIRHWYYASINFLQAMWVFSNRIVRVKDAAGRLKTWVETTEASAHDNFILMQNSPYCFYQNSRPNTGTCPTNNKVDCGEIMHNTTQKHSQKKTLCFSIKWCMISWDRYYINRALSGADSPAVNFPKIVHVAEIWTLWQVSRKLNPQL